MTKQTAQGRSVAPSFVRGSHVRTIGLGARGVGTVSRDPDGSAYIHVRSFAYGGERLVPIARVRLVRRPRVPR